MVGRRCPAEDRVGLEEFRDVTYGGNGMIYAVATDGRSFGTRDLARNGTTNWANGGTGQPIGQGWTVFVRILSGQNGIPVWDHG